MLAKAFISIDEPPPDCIVFASGVSNSNCIEQANFLRERELLKKELNKVNQDIRFIYFSTCSIYDEQLINSPYVKHKKLMENIVLSNENGIVFRLAQIAGPCSPPNTLLQSIRRSAMFDKSIEIWINAKRNILDVIDVRDIIIYMLNNKNIISNCINIANTKSHSIIEIVNTFEKVLQKKIKKIYLEKGCEYSIDISLIKNQIHNMQIDDESYLEKTIRKYYHNF